MLDPNRPFNSSWIQVASGNLIHTAFDSTSIAEINHILKNVDIKDIAFGLARIYRFTGHSGPVLREDAHKGFLNFFARLIRRRLSDRLYSVAEHSIIASYLAPPELQYEALMHDTHEAYFGDMGAPLKSQCPAYQHLIANFDRHILSRKFGLPPTMRPEVKEIDFRLLWTEALAMCAPPKASWFEGKEPEPYKNVTFRYLTPSKATKEFLARYEELRPKGA